MLSADQGHMVSQKHKDSFIIELHKEWQNYRVYLKDV